MGKKYKIFITAGGTGGHILPGLSIYNLLKKDKHAVKFICRKKDYEFIADLKKIRKDLIFLSGFGLKRKIDLRNFLFFGYLFLNIIKMFFIFLRFYPSAVIAMGGYITFPVILMSWMFRKPFFLCEQNSYPGMVNRIFGNKAKMNFINFSYSKKFFKRSLITGNPIRQELQQNISQKDAYKFFQFNAKKRVILIMGGSQGALNINNVVKDSISDFKKYNIIWLVGKNNYKNLKKYSGKNVKIFGFFNKMTLAYKAADIAICRAGAMSITELSYFGVPAVFIPLPSAANNHQYLNANTILKLGGSDMILEKNLNKKVLTAKMHEMLDNDVLLKQYKNNIKKFFIEDSAEKIVKQLYLMLNT